jgi:hypothetical protein
LLVIELIFRFIKGIRRLGIYACFKVINTSADKVKALFLPLFPLLLVLRALYKVRLNISIASVIERSYIILITLCSLPLALVILFLSLTFIGSKSKTRALLLLITLISFVKY